MAFRLQLAGLSAANWSALFWITLLFTAISTVGKSFMGEHKGRDFYYYALASPQRYSIGQNAVWIIDLFAFSILVFAI